MHPFDDDCPHPQSEAATDFERRRAIDWLDPVELARSGVKAGLAAVFGAFADRREMQAALSPPGKPEEEYGRHDFVDGALWFDYVADVGDGFDATYAIARLLAAGLTVDGVETHRGAFVVLGGDQVYPTASRDEYHQRFLGPYRAALPWVDPDGVVPKMYAIPGNHDWYDGLTSFLHIFCQRKPGETHGRWIGGWQTAQRRSYFAVKLPDDWWIWAIDGQLDSEFDQPQLRYFSDLAKTMQPAEKQKIILVTAQPSWTQCPAPGSPPQCRNAPEDFRTLAYFEKTILEQGFQLKLVLAGDLHHYMRYESADAGPKATRVTSGGGGAYALGTAHMPEKLLVAGRPYECKGAFPGTQESQGIARKVWNLPWHNWRFGVLLGVVYLVLAWLLQAGSRAVGPEIIEGSLLDVVQKHGPVLETFGTAFLFNPLATIFALLIVFGLWKFTAASRKGHPGFASALGLLHGVAHVALCCALSWAIARGLVELEQRPRGVAFNLLYILLMIVLGMLLGSLLFAAFLRIISAATGVHANEVFSAVHSEDSKSFLRFRLGADGVLQVYSIGLRRVPHDWEFEVPGPNDHGRPWFHSEKFGKGEYAPRIVDRFELR